MAHVSCPRRSMVLALLATTAAASLLGACGQTASLFSRGSAPEEVQMTAAEAASATSQWAAAYAKNPKDPQMALGYARALRAIGSKDRSLDILSKAYRVNPDNGPIAAELGRVALETGQVDMAAQALAAAESNGVNGWKILSAKGTLHAKKGEHDEAQKYYRAALEENPDSTSVINNLALSYALDGEADEAEALLRKAAESGQDDKRIRQNLAMVLGIQGKFDEAREVAAVDMTAAQAKTSMSYLRNMLNKPTQVASADAHKPAAPDDAAEDWSPFGYDEPKAPPVQAAAPVQAPVQAASLPSPAKVQVVTPVDEVTAPGKPTQIVNQPAAPTPAPAPAQVATATPPAPPAVRAKVTRVPESLPIVRASTAPLTARKPASTNTTVMKSTPAVVRRPVPKTAGVSSSADATHPELIIEITPPTP